MDWEIARIVEDLGARDAERWLIVCTVPDVVAPDGIYSTSMPKTMLNAYAAAYEYNIEDPEHMDQLFDLVLNIPMLSYAKSVPVTADALLQDGAEASADALERGRAATSESVWLRRPEVLRADVKAGIDVMKAGHARLDPAPVVDLSIRGLPAVVRQDEENPKYIVKRDMVSRIDPKVVARNLEIYRGVRARRMAQLRSET